MKVKISYVMPVEKEIEMTPAEYCQLHASFNYKNNFYFPVESMSRDLSIDKEAEKELWKFFQEKNERG